MPTGRFSGLVLGTNLSGTDNADGTITIDASGGGGSAPGYGTSLPGSPSDGDEYILVDSTTTPTYAWRFRYNASGSTAYDWEFIGGHPVTAEVLTSQTRSSNTYGDLATVGPSITVPRAGVYRIEIGAQMIQGGAGSVAMTVKLGSAAASDNESVTFYTAAGTSYAQSYRVFDRTLAASDVLLCQYRSPNSVTVEFARRIITVTPRRVS